MRLIKSKTRNPKKKHKTRFKILRKSEGTHTGNILRTTAQGNKKYEAMNTYEVMREETAR